jgi:hypothetical protein
MARCKRPRCAHRETRPGDPATRAAKAMAEDSSDRREGQARGGAGGGPAGRGQPQGKKGRAGTAGQASGAAAAAQIPKSCMHATAMHTRARRGEQHEHARYLQPTSLIGIRALSPGY